ncbi:MAG: hypothetical protein PWP70_1970 [Moorella sp. (in: firmicutes)]|nr:hypothetical protein [Moorella sp. (in: firmicutes)]
MLFLGHAGLTLAAARVMEKMMVPGGRQRPGSRPGPPELIDYRLVLIGSMLPDIIDKPLGGVIFKETLGNGRIYAHTLVFLLFAWAAALLWWRRYRRPGGLVLAGGSLMHHLLDGMWRYPATFLWPLCGWGFPRGHPEEWFWQWLAGLLHDPWVYVPEAAGGIVLLFFFGQLVYREGMMEFFTRGRF